MIRRDILFMMLVLLLLGRQIFEMQMLCKRKGCCWIVDPHLLLCRSLFINYYWMK